MAQGHFKKADWTNEETGEVTEVFNGQIMTLQDRLEVQLVPIEGNDAEINSDKPTHLVMVKAVYGEFVECGSGWTKQKTGGPVFINGTINDKYLKFTMYPVEGQEGEYKALVSHMQRAA